MITLRILYELIRCKAYNLSSLSTQRASNTSERCRFRCFPWARDISSPAIWATKISAHFGDNNADQMSRQVCSHTPSALNAGAKRRATWPCLIVATWRSEEATEPYNKYAKLFKYIS